MSYDCELALNVNLYSLEISICDKLLQLKTYFGIALNYSNTYFSNNRV